MHCRHCGQEMSSGAKFCEKCGAPLAATPAPASAPLAPPPVVKRKRPSLIIRIGGSFLVLCVLLGVAGYIYVQFQDSDTPGASAGASASTTATDTSSTSASDDATTPEASDAPTDTTGTINSLADFRRDLPGEWCALITRVDGSVPGLAWINKYVIDNTGQHYKEYFKMPTDAAFGAFAEVGTITYTTGRYSDTGTRYFMATLNGSDHVLIADPGDAEGGTVWARQGTLMGGTASHDCVQYE